MRLLIVREPREDFEVLAGSEHCQAITLVLHADIGELRILVGIGSGGDLVGLEVGLDGVALRAGMAQPALALRPLGDGRDLAHHAIAGDFASPLFNDELCRNLLAAGPFRLGDDAIILKTLERGVELFLALILRRDGLDQPEVTLQSRECLLRGRVIERRLWSREVRELSRQVDVKSCCERVILFQSGEVVVIDRDVPVSQPDTRHGDDTVVEVERPRRVLRHLGNDADARLALQLADLGVDEDRGVDVAAGASVLARVIDRARTRDRVLHILRISHLQKLTVRVVEQHRELLLLRRLEQRLDRHDERGSGLMIVGNRRFSGLRRDRVSGWLHVLNPDAVHHRLAGEIDPSVRDDRRGIHVAMFEPQCVNLLQSLGFIGREDEPATVAVDDVDLAVSIDRATATHRADFLLTNLLARLQIVHEEDAAVIDRVDAIANHQRPRPTNELFLRPPDFARLGDVARLGGVEGEDRAHRGVVQVLFTVSADDLSADDRRSGVDAAQRDIVVPDLLAGARLEAVDAAVARGHDQLSLPVDDRDCGATVRRVFRQRLCPLEPDSLSVALVERDDPIRRASHLAPADHDAADDDQILMNDRVVGPPAVGTQQPKLFAHRVRPNRLAGLAINALKVAADTLREDMPGLGITDHT